MNIKNEVAVGVFFIIALAILGYFTIIMSGELFERHEFYYLTVQCPNVEGLGKSDKVKVNGVLSGIVIDITLNDNQVFVKLRMYNSFTMYENYKIQIRNETALGGKYVSIFPGSKFHRGKEYKPADLKATLHGGAVDDPFSLISEFIQENREDVHSTIANIREITEKINSGKGTLGKLVNENRVYDNADSLIRELRDAIEDAREQAPITSFIRAALMAF